MTGLGPAALPMYDFPEVRDAVNRLWSDLRYRLDRKGIAAPPALARDLSLPELLGGRPLLLAQCCGAHVARHAGLRVLGVAGHAVAGCGSGFYHSCIVVRRDDLGRWRGDPSAALAEAVLAVNEPTSHSGRTALLLWLAERHGLLDEALPTRLTGAHRASLAALRDGSADLAGIDAVSLALLERHAPDEVEGLAVLDRSLAAPALPYVTGAATPEPIVLALQRALAETLADPGTAAARQALLLGDFHRRGREDYAPIAVMERRVAAAGLTLAVRDPNGADDTTA